MDSGHSLKVIAVRSRWAYEELVYDEKMKEWNQLTSDQHGALFAYLKEQYGSRWGAVKALRMMLREAGRDVPKIVMSGTHFEEEAVKEEYRRIKRYEPWVLEELAFERKKQEAVTLFETVGAMFRYLITLHGKPQRVLKLLMWLERTQPGRLKTLCLGL